MKRAFDVLSRHTKIYDNALLEASAGTGKTFSIEHLLVRLLLEEDPTRREPCRLKEILAMTFTRAATREMKGRMRTNIERAIAGLEGAERDLLPDYLKVHLEAGPEGKKRAIQRLKEAWNSFDEAQIFTLHGFCSRLLQEHAGSVFLTINESPPVAVALEVVKRFFRGEMSTEWCSLGQLKKLIGYFRGEVESLQLSLAKDAVKGILIKQEPRVIEDFHQFCSIMKRLQENYGWSTEKIVEDFDKQVGDYKVLEGIKAESLRPSIVHFARLCMQDSWTLDEFHTILEEGCPLARLELKARAKEVALHYPQLPELLRQHLQPLLKAASNPKRIYASLAAHCQQLVWRHFADEELTGPDQILQQMREALKGPLFLAKAQKRYRFAIIDEFQDTDPLQWEIVNEMFLKAAAPAPYLVIVGDPKQSIYAFRQADIYTYLRAAEQFAPEQHCVLQVNYRSQPALVTALNALFSEKNTPGWMTLPRLESSLTYREVSASPTSPSHFFQDKRGAVHFFLFKALRGRLQNWPGEDYERRFIFAYIANEILRLHQEEAFDFNQIAVLVRDRYQAAALRKLLHERGIPSSAQRQGSLTESKAFTALKEWLEAVFKSHESALVKCALGGPLIGCKMDQLSGELEEKERRQFDTLARVLQEQGFAVHLEALLESCWQDNSTTVRERLISSPGGAEFYRDLRQISDRIVTHQVMTHATLEGLLSFLDEMESLALYEEGQGKIQTDPTEDAVQILTMHMSKGLEFEIVFAPGLTKRTDPDEKLIQEIGEEGPLLRFMEKERPYYRTHCREVDAEKARQAYVAMTRAKYRLYLPVALASDGSKIEIGEAAPLELLLARLNRPMASEEEIYERINQETGESLCTFIDQFQEEFSLSYEWLSEEPQPLLNPSIPSPSLVKMPPVPSVPEDSLRLYSFTLLQKTSSIREDKEDSPTAPYDYRCLEKTVHTLPAGRETGILMHRLLEKLTAPLLKEAEESKFLPWVASQVAGTPFQGWELPISQMLVQACKTPLFFDGDQPISLSQTDPARHLRECAFLYPMAHHGFFKGAIDLLVGHADRYYLIDWKTNWLGMTQEAYHPNLLKEAVLREGYHLQAQIYSEAVRRYLRLDELKEPFGGVYFLFLRGMSSSLSPHFGVYYDDFSSEPLENAQRFLTLGACREPSAAALSGDRMDLS